VKYEVATSMVDMQSEADARELAIDNVGVSSLKYPVVVLDKAHEKQSTVANISMSVALPARFKGTHMSRFVEILNEHRGELTLRTMPDLLATLRSRLLAESARVVVAFPYFLERAAPASGAKGLCDYECSFIGATRNGVDELTLCVRVPVTSVCPCSKAISDYGAHNQRGYIDIEVRTANGDENFVWIEELVQIAEASASAPVYALLKREDERYVTMQAYDHPVFVEDMVRGVAQSLRADSRVVWFRVHAENHESIHNHSAFAEILWERTGDE